MATAFLILFMALPPTFTELLLESEGLLWLEDTAEKTRVKKNWIRIGVRQVGLPYHNITNLDQTGPNTSSNVPVRKVGGGNQMLLAKSSSRNWNPPDTECMTPVWIPFSFACVWQHNILRQCWFGPQLRQTSNKTRCKCAQVVSSLFIWFYCRRTIWGFNF